MDRMCSGSFYTGEKLMYLRTRREYSIKINLIIEYIKM